MFFAISIIGLPFQNRFSAGDSFGLIINGLSLIPIYGYAYQVAIGSKGIAIGIFIVNLPAFILGAHFGISLLLEKQSYTQLFFSLLGLVVMCVMFYPVYKYAFGSKNLWSSNA